MATLLAENRLRHTTPPRAAGDTGERLGHRVGHRPSECHRLRSAPRWPRTPPSLFRKQAIQSPVHIQSHVQSSEAPDRRLRVQGRCIGVPGLPWQPHSAGGCKSAIQGRRARFLRRPLSLAGRRPSFPWVLTWPALCPRLGPNFPFS